MRSNQKGFGHVLLLVLLVAVAVVGFAAYRVWSSQDKTSTANTSTSAKSDTLTSSNKELDQLGSQLDSDLDDSQLNADLDSM